MGCVCSCFSTVFMWTGELLENIFLAIGEIGSILVRGIFAILIGLCDVMAAISCCWRVPYDERPDRASYTYKTVATNVNRGSVLSTKLLATPQQRQDAKQRKELVKQEYKARVEAAKAQKAAASKSAAGVQAKAQEATQHVADAVDATVERAATAMAPSASAQSSSAASAEKAAAAKPAAAQAGWFSGWFGGSAPAAAKKA